jgi:zinc protease
MTPRTTARDGARRSARACLALAILALLPAGPARAGALGPWHAPAPVVKKLPNGLEVFVFPDARLPVVQIQLRVPAGVDREPADQSGVAALTAQMLTAGTTSRDAGTFAAELEAIGGSIAATPGREYAILAGAFLSRDFESGIELLGDAVVNPIFPESEFEANRAAAARGVMELQQNPAAAAEEQLWTLALPEQPGARPEQGTLESLLRLTRDQVRAFHRANVRPEGSLLAIAGDVTPERAFAAAEEWFGRWAPGSGPPAAPRAAGPSAGGTRIRVVDTPGPACVIRLGVRAPGAGAEDDLARSLSVRILGDRMAARLTGTRGSPAWEAAASLGRLQEAGLLVLSAAGPADSAAAIVRRLRAELRRYLSSTPATADLEAVRHSVQRAFPLQFEPLAALLSRWVDADFRGLPRDYFDTYRGRIAALTAADLASAARRAVDPARLSIVAAGPAKTLEARLGAFGKVEVAKLDAAAAEAAPADTPPPPTAAQRARAREIVDAAVAAHGGLERLKNLKASLIDADVRISIQGRDIDGTLRQLRKEPYKMVYLTSIEGFQSRQVLNGRRAWSVRGDSSQAVREADSLEVGLLRAGFESDVPHILLAALDPAASIAARGRERVGDREADVVEVVAPSGERRKLFIGTADHLLIGLEHQEPGMAGRAIGRRVYGGFRTVDGIQWPFVEERFLMAERVMRIQITNLVLNPAVGEADFQAPATGRGQPGK